MEYLLPVSVLILFALLFLNLRRINNRPESTTKFLLLFPVIIFVVLTSILLYPVLTVYRSLVTLVLKIKLGKKFYGLLYGLDNMTALNSVSGSIIGILLVFEIDKINGKRDLIDCVTSFVNTKVLNNPYLSKLYTTLKSYGGYNYLENINVTSEDCIQKLPLLDGDIDNSALQRLLAQGHYLPFNGSMLWDVLVGTQPLQRRPNDNTNVQRYPIVIRVHHLIADGVTLTQLTSGVLGDKLETDLKTFPARKITEVPILQLIKYTLNVIAYFPSTMYLIFTKTADSNELHGKPQTNMDKIALKFDENGTYLRKVKNIRKHTGATIPEIILTAFTESVREYFIKNDKHCPKQVTFVIPLVHDKSELQNIRSMNIKDIDLRNKFISIPLQVPFSISDVNKNEKFPIYTKLKLIRNITNELKTSMEYQVSYITFHMLVPILPTCCIRQVTRFLHCTGLVSLLPEVPKKTVYNGKALATDCIFWIPHLIGIGITFGSISYDNRLILSLNCTEAYMTQAQVEEMLNNTYNNISLLEKEVEN